METDGARGGWVHPRGFSSHANHAPQGPDGDVEQTRAMSASPYDQKVF